MNDQPKRRWFQIHLSTAITGLIVVSLLVALSTLPHEYADGLVTKYGWPWDNAVTKAEGLDKWYTIIPDHDVFRVGQYLVALRYVLLDALVLICAFAMAGIVLEYLIRRREVRKPPA